MCYLSRYNLLIAILFQIIFPSIKLLTRRKSPLSLTEVAFQYCDLSMTPFDIQLEFDVGQCSKMTETIFQELKHLGI